MAQIAVLITHQEVYGERRSLEDLRALLRPLSFYSVLVSLGKINAVMRTWLNEPDQETDGLVCRLLFGVDSTRVEGVRRRYPAAVAFTRLTLLYVCRQAALACAANGQAINSSETFFAIGRACLIANDLFSALPIGPSSAIRDKAAALIPFSSYIGRVDYMNAIARSQIILAETTRLPQVAASADFAGLEQLFEQATGISVSDFVALVFGLLSRYLRLTLDDLFREPDTYFVPPSFFGRTAIESATVERFVGLISVAVDELRGRLERDAERPLTDMFVFQNCPCVRNERGALFCVDPIALIEKASSGLYWTLNATPYAAKNRLFRFWGLLFEEYINGLLANAYNPANGQFVAKALFEDGAEVSDACVVEGQDLILLEHKASILTAEAKYSGDVAAFEADVVQKLVGMDAPGERKGVLQLAHSVERIVRGDRIPSLPNLRPTRIFSVLVVQDSVFASPFMNAYLNGFFPKYRLRKVSRTTITPVFALTVADVEDLCCYLHSCRLSDLLDEHYAQNPSLVQAFRSVAHPILQRTECRTTPVRERFTSFSDEMIRRFFPEEGAPAILPAPPRN